jgi:hypothetical protein
MIWAPAFAGETEVGWAMEFKIITLQRLSGLDVLVLF